MCIGAHAATETINWYMDGNTYATTQCETGGDIILPQTPYKYGYTFNGWSANYTPIEYLESTGTQWIDTGIKPTKNTKINIVLQLTALREDYVFGFFDSNGQYYLYVNVNGQWQWGWSSQYRNIGKADTQKHNIKIYSEAGISKIEIDNIVIDSAQLLSHNAGVNTPLFKGLENNSGYSGLPQKLYSAQIYDNDVLVRDFIPVLDKDGVPCMYDKAEGKFYYNAGTGQFIAGPVIGE